jgi:hypothetical protein
LGELFLYNEYNCICTDGTIQGGITVHQGLFWSRIRHQAVSLFNHQRRSKQSNQVSLYQRRFSIAKIYGIHEIEVNADLDEKTLKSLFNEFAKDYEEQPGWKLTLLKGDRRQRAGK